MSSVSFHPVWSFDIGDGKLPNEMVTMIIQYKDPYKLVRFSWIFSEGGSGNTAQVSSTEISGVKSQESHHRKIMVCVFACPQKLYLEGSFLHEMG